MEHPPPDLDERGLSRLLEANALIARSEDRAMQIAGFAGFTLPLLGGLLPTGFEDLSGAWHTAAVGTLIGALICLGVSILFGLTVLVGTKRFAITPDALGQLLDRGLDRDDYVRAYSERLGYAKQVRGGVIRAASVYGAGLGLAVACLGIISVSP